ncbi:MULTISPECIES: hypothetical protein [Herbaspirillum]|uniref:Uncharacterized protein n=2 Tax=Herbaspirillum huttiense TaxID=863372 RepID=A0AAJ2LRI3_9BURK|nr:MULTISPECIES: hypothetical protein [Herbaspirillum]MDR9836807.1 hypothetical protein [Herbaspirillum huttiense]
MNEANILTNDPAIRVLQDARRALEALGVPCVLAPMALPQGMTISLHVGGTVQEATAARVAAVIGGASAHETVAGKKFEAELAEALADDTIAKAAYKPLS